MDGDFTRHLHLQGQLAAASIAVADLSADV